MKKNNPTSLNSLRAQAEDILKSRHPITGMPLSEAEIYELQVSQIELELRNKELIQVNGCVTGFNTEQKYHYMFESNPQPMWIYDLETLAFLEVNDAAVHHYGYSKEEFRGMTLKDIRPEEDVERLKKDVEATNKIYNSAGEWRHRKKNGDIIRVEIVSHTVTYEGRIARHVMINDISERKHVEEALYRSEERSRNALNHLLEGCQIIGFDWRYIYLNHTAEIHNKRANHELIGKRYMDEWPGIEDTEVFKVIKQTLETRVANHLENEFIFPDGSRGWFDLSIQPVQEGVFILSIDITERKRAENDLRASEEKYRLIADNSDDWIYWIAPDGCLHYVSPACERVTGYSPEEFTNHPELNHDIVFEADKAKVSQHTQISKLDDTPHNLEFRIITKTGEIRWVNHSCSPIFNDEGEYMGRRGTNRNITDRKRQEEQLFESEFRFSKLYEEGPFGMVIADKEFRFKKVNPAFCAIMGYAEEELLQYTFKDISYPDDLKKDLLNLQKLNNKEIAVYRTEKRYIRKDGQTIWGSLTLTATYDSEGQFLYNLGIIEDITRRKQAEEDLKKSKKLLSETESMGKVGGWEFNIDTKQQTWTEEVYRIHEVDLDFNQNVDKGIDFYSPASRPIIEKAVQRVIEFGEPFDVELEIITAKGNLRSVHSVGKADLENRRVYGFFQDITERKRAEEELMKTRNQLAKIFETSPGIVCTSHLRPNGTVCFPYGGERLAEYFGIPTAHLEEDATPYFALIHPDDVKDLLTSIEESAKKLTPWRYEWRMLHPVNGLMWIEGHSMPVREQDGSTLWHGIATNITNRKLAEEEIIRLNERISTATRASQVGIWDWDIQNNLLAWDDQMYALYGLKKDEFTAAYQTWVNGLYPDDKEFSQEETQLALRGEKDYDTEFRVIWPDATVHFIKARGEVYRNETGDPIRMVGINFDITEQKIIDQKIREKDQEFRKLSANVSDLLFQFTRRTDGTYCVPIASEGIRNIFGCAPEDVINDFTPIGRVIYPEDAERVIRDIEYSAEHLTFFTCEFRVQIPGREIQWIYSKSTPERLPDGSVTWYGFNTDITHKKLAEEALKISEERYRNIFESAVIGIYRTTPEGKIIMANSTLINILGFQSFEELAQRNLETDGFESDNERNKFRKSIERDGRVIGLESVWKTKDGQSVVVNENAKAFYDNSGRVIYYEGTIEDITRRKHTEKTLQESEEKFRKAFATNPDSITITRLLDGMYVSVNSGFTQIFGYAEEETVGRTPLDINMWHNPDDRKQFVNELKTKGTVENFEARLCTKDGKIKDTLVSATILEFDGLPHVLSTTKDITERKLAEEALRESEEKFRKLIESIPLPVTYLNSLGEIAFRNDRFMQVMGYSYEEVPTVNEWWGKAYPDETYRRWVIQNWESVVKNATETNTDIEPIEYNITCKDGVERTMIVSGIIIEDNLLITFIDITDRKKAEKEIIKLNETLEQRVEERTTQLQEANRELEAFSYSVSHDLRAPLRHINGFVDLLTENYTDLLPEKGKHYLDVIVNSSRHMGTLIDDLLQFSRTGRQEMQETDLNMNEVLQDVLNQVKHDTENRNIEWDLVVLPNIKGDQSLLRMVWYNLLSNAVKFTKAKDPAKIQVGFTDDEKEYTFFVLDNGAGFDMRFAHKLFGVFQRLHTTKEFEGTGIGLANVRRIILKHGGRTWAESQINEGATFYFTLPKPK